MISVLSRACSFPKDIMIFEGVLMRLLIKTGISPLKLILVVLFFILGLGEFSDGVYDVGDYAVPLLLCLMLNDVYMNWKRNQENPVQSKPEPVVKKSLMERISGFVLDVWYSGSSRGMSNQEKALKIIMNNIFFILFLSPIFMELLSIEYVIKTDVFKIGVIIWSGAFMAVSINDFKKSLKISKLIYTNVAFFILIGTLIIL
jgi:hypothetical protein